MSAAEKFNTGEVRYWYPPQLKTSKQIIFPKPYVATPGLHMGLNSLDIGNSANIRVTAYANEFKPNYFRVHVDGWGNDTQIYSAEYQHGQFSTTEHHPHDRPQHETSRRIKFSCPFVTPPKVVFLQELDMWNAKNWQVTTWAADVDEFGFTIHINTWADTVLYGATAGWIVSNISSGDIEFWRPPDVFVARNSLNVDCATNLRLNATVNNITTMVMTWHIDSWADTVLYSAGISYIAVV
ncbi:hypothetical protein BDD12DRAFT_918270 [Trichophaea hybrida]|nr:hypothetical protein BDD12DRAFT_918270 [Trichophaea hybrida]